MHKYIVPFIAVAIMCFGAYGIYMAMQPKPEPLFEVTFTDSNMLGIDVPFIEEESMVYRTKTRPIRTQILAGSRYSFIDENGNLIELKGSYDFEVKQIGWIPIDDPRHSQNK
jgi:hypothetical protein